MEPDPGHAGAGSPRRTSVPGNGGVFISGPISRPGTGVPPADPQAVPANAERIPGRSGRGRALVVADGDVPDRDALDAAWPGWDAGLDLIVAADGGWEKAAGLGLRPDLLVGDADSLPEARFRALAADGVDVERSPAAKDESDTELALLAALRRGAAAVTIVGALGGRLDHALANIWLLALGGPDVEIDLLDASCRVRLLRAPDLGDDPAATLRVDGPVGGLVTLLPFAGRADGVTTAGLRYPLNDESLELGPARGLSNVRTAIHAAVTLRHGQLLVIESAPGPIAAAHPNSTLEKGAIQ